MKLFIRSDQGALDESWIKQQLSELGIKYDDEIKLGEVRLNAVIPEAGFAELKHRFEQRGMSFVHDRRQILSEQIKYIVHELLSLSEKPNKNYSHYISERLFLNYTYLANIFSETQGITIEHFIINQKIEKVKQLLLFSDLSISQIADELQYSSIGHLSNQFKKVTGLTASEFKKSCHKLRV